jgi:Glycosyl hydrolase family 26
MRINRLACILVFAGATTLLASSCSDDGGASVEERYDSGVFASTDVDASLRAADAARPDAGLSSGSSDAASGPSRDAAQAGSLDGGDARTAEPVSDAAGPALDASKDGSVLDAGSRRDARIDAQTQDAQTDARTPPASTKPLLGAYCGNSVEGLKQFEQWLGRPVDGVLGYTGNASWEDYDGSVGWAAGLWSAIDRRVFWSVPLIANGASLAQAGTGAYDEHYRKAAQTLAAYRPQDAQLYVRTGWEFNGNWFPWNAQGKASDFVAAFRRFVTVFRSVSNRFVFEWNVNVGDVGMDPETAYPGDDYVDIIGMDFYWQPSLPSNAQQAWAQIVDQKWGLAWHQNFAKAHNKPTSYSEWGIRSNEAAYYIQQAKLWFESHPVLFHTYWNADNEYPGKLSSGQYPNAGAAYRAAFGP